MSILLKELLKDKINQKKQQDARRLIIERNLFDHEYYINQYPQVAEENMDLLDHYLEIGYKDGLNPSEEFDTKYYLKMYGDVRVSNINPLVHYVLYGAKEGRKCNDKLTDDEINTYKQLIYDNNLFDEEYYYTQYPDLKSTDLDPLTHYLLVGADEGANPSKQFDTVYYQINNKDKLTDDINPLIHYVIKGMDDELITHIELTQEEVDECVRIIDNSNTFDEEYYVSQNPQLLNQNINFIEHYVKEGAFDRLNPSKSFNTSTYLKYNPDVRAKANNPYVHYLKRGKKEGRVPLETKKMQRHERDYENYVAHQVDVIEKSGLFDKEYYLEKYDEVKYYLVNPIEHYVTKGAYEGKNPSKSFNSNYYLYHNPDVNDKKLNPLFHYITVGKKEGRGRTISHIVDRDNHYYENKIYEKTSEFGYTKYDRTSPMVSIILLNRDGAHHLRRLLGTFKQRTTYPNYEMIIVDNNSSDDSIEVIESHDELPIRLIRNEVNRSFSYANNQAVEVSNGKYLLFLNNDMETCPGWLNHLMDTALSDENIGAVGSKLIYPDASSSVYNIEKSFTIQHAGIVFKQKNGYVRPYNKDNGMPYEFEDNTPKERVAVTAATLLVEKNKYEEVGGFDNDYEYGFEDVDLCLKLYRKGYRNYYNPKSVLFHYEFGTQESNEKEIVKNRRIKNKEVFTRKWNTWLKREVFLDKLYKNKLFTDSPLKVGLVVSQSGKNVQAGDYFTALGLSDSLVKLGYTTQFLAIDHNEYENSAYDVDGDIDVVISLLDKYDINQIKSDNTMLIKIAWVRNWIERWVEQDFFEDFDLIMASSQKAIDYIRQHTGFNPILFPIATDTSMFNTNMEAVDEYRCDYCFTGSFWNADRDIISCLSPDDLEYAFSLYGANWEKLPHLRKYHKGFINFSQMPQLYASTEIVIDDANHVTKKYGSVNSRVFDAIASGKLVITNGTLGNKELFNGLLPEYHSKEELNKQIDYYMQNKDKRDELVAKLQDIVLDNHTYDIRANTLISILTDYVSHPKVLIKAPIPRSKNKFEWGDYFFGRNLQREFNKKSYYSKIQLLDDWDNLNDGLYDIILVLRGLSVYTPKSQHYNVMWNISHPDDITLGEYNSFDKVYVASTYWTSKLKELLDVDVESLLQCTDDTKFKEEYDASYDTELLFVGNSRMVYRKILKDLLPTKHKLDVYGAMWESIIDEKYLKGEYIDNDELYKAYSSTKVLLNDHWDDMRERGFISNRIFDAIACGTVVLTDHVKGIEDLFPEAVVYYDTPEQLEDKIREALKIESVNPDLIKSHTYEKRVEKIISDYE
ncbi:MAG: glycosyltransferase [Methanosphaera sp.]|nr:glycosyltransferase [Methanosphaera sp.]